MIQQIKYSVIKEVLFFIIIAPLFFWGLDFLPVMHFDKGRLAINALEMYNNGFSIHTTFYNEVDFWNTKPPLMIWLEVASMKTFGFNLIAFRLPAAFLVGLLVLYYFILFYQKI